jgi:hypothetical protein
MCGRLEGQLYIQLELTTSNFHRRLPEQNHQTSSPNLLSSIKFLLLPLREAISSPATPATPAFPELQPRRFTPLTTRSPTWLPTRIPITMSTRRRSIWRTWATSYPSFPQIRWSANRWHSDVSGAERKEEDDTATAILKKKKKPNQLMYV